jgi:MFS family permease
VIYGAGSLTTALAPTLTVLLIGWSFLEGVGAALILPAIVALVAGNFPQARRPAAYGLVAAAGAGLRCLVTVSDYTATEDFAEASLVVTSLGDPGGEVTRVLANRSAARPGGWVSLADLEAILRR